MESGRDALAEDRAREFVERARAGDGKAFAELVRAFDASLRGPTRDGVNPPSRFVVSLACRYGLSQFIVTTRATGPDAGGWRDPFGPAPRAARQATTLAGGALSGTDAEVVVAPEVTPHLWAVNDELVVTIAGHLTRDELVQVAGSLRIP